MVVRRIVTSVVRKVLSRPIDGMKVARRTSAGSGFANNDEPIYANRASVSHLKMFAISRYEQKICRARMMMTSGTIIQTIGIGTMMLMPAAIAPMSAPALIVLATNRATTAGYSSG